MIIRWQVQDGYCGGSRPQTTHIDDEELKEFETDEEREEFIESYIQEDFEQTISWCELGRE